MLEYAAIVVFIIAVLDGYRVNVHALRRNIKVGGFNTAAHATAYWVPFAYLMRHLEMSWIVLVVIGFVISFIINLTSGIIASAMGRVK